TPDPRRAPARPARCPVGLRRGARTCPGQWGSPVRSARADRGSATVYALFAFTLLALACVVVMQVAAVARLQHKVTAAADLAAIAAARAAVAGGDGCAAAEGIARRNHTELVGCQMDAAVATLEVRATTPRM